MAPIVFDELNVFTFPHSRMRKLMNCCTAKVGHTDFTSLDDFEQLLIRLQRTFIEFMAHEEIENQFVMKKLKKKLKQQATIDDTELICNCHKEDRFTPLMSLFRDGYAFIRRGNADRVSYGLKLHKAMLTFYDDFVPHMHEEENDIQPLLSRHFTEMELKIMRIEVIKMTLQKRENPASNFVEQIERPLKIYVISYERIVSINHLSKEILEHVMKYLSSDQLRQSCLRVNKQWNLCATKVLQGRSPICSIPDEILLRLFTFYVNPSDLFRSCVRVNKRWNQICQDRTIWKIVNPINWSKGVWNSNVPVDEMCSSDDEYLKTKESDYLNGFVQCFLPTHGYAIENLILAASLTINDNLARKIFDSCPNVKHVNVAMTKLTSKAFLHFRWIRSLESLNVEGCDSMDDHLFEYLISSSKMSRLSSEWIIEDKQQCPIERLHSPDNSMRKCHSCPPRCSSSNEVFQLQILNLSGCYRISDAALNRLIEHGLTRSLQFIDLSGCVQVTSECVASLLNSSRNLPVENLCLCDNLQSSSNLSTANCCRNVENSSGRYCCRWQT